MAASSVGELLYMNTDHADVIFVVDGEEIPGHRVVISAVCPHFETLLYGHFKESNSKHVEIKETSPKAFQELIQFIYKGQLDVSDWIIEEVVALMALAHRYEFQLLFNKVVQLLQQRPLNLDSWTLVHDVATLYDSKALKEKCISFAESKMNDFFLEKDLDKFTGPLICAMLESPKVSTYNQDQLLCALFEWKSGRTSSETMSVLEKICWEKVSPDITAIIVKEFFSNFKNADDFQFWSKGVTLFKERKAKEDSKCVARVESVVLPKDSRMKFAMAKNKGTLCLGRFRDYVALGFANGYSKAEITVKRIEFESETNFNIESISSCDSFGEETKIIFSEPTSINGRFKYRAVFSEPTPMNGLFVRSDDFKNMILIILRNILIS